MDPSCASNYYCVVSSGYHPVLVDHVLGCLLPQRSFIKCVDISLLSPALGQMDVMGGDELMFFRVSAVWGNLLPLYYRIQPHLSLSPFRHVSRQSESTLHVRIKASKTDPFRLEVTVVLGATGTDLCPNATIMPYLACRGAGNGLPFHFENGSFMTRDSFVIEVRRILDRACMEASHYSGHSFHIGGASDHSSSGWNTRPHNQDVGTLAELRLPGIHSPTTSLLSQHLKSTGHQLTYNVDSQNVQPLIFSALLLYTCHANFKFYCLIVNSNSNTGLMVNVGKH